MKSRNDKKFTLRQKKQKDLLFLSLECTVDFKPMVVGYSEGFHTQPNSPAVLPTQTTREQTIKTNKSRPDTPDCEHGQSRLPEILHFVCPLSRNFAPSLSDAASTQEPCRRTPYRQPI